MKLSIIIPIYNEWHTGEIVLNMLASKEIESLEKEIIVVESNSTDGSREMVQSFEGRDGFRIIYQDNPQGKGNAVREGLESATGDIILIQDADLEYSLDDYEKVLEPILSNRACFVLGTRHKDGLPMRSFEKGKIIAFIYNLAHKFFTELLNVTLKTRMTDPFTMFKVFRHEIIKDIVFTCNRFDFDWELVIKIIKKGYIPIEVPVNYKSRDYHGGKKVRPFYDTCTWIRAWWKHAILAK